MSQKSGWASDPTALPRGAVLIGAIAGLAAGLFFPGFLAHNCGAALPAANVRVSPCAAALDDAKLKFKQPAAGAIAAGSAASKEEVAPVAVRKAEPFSLGDVRLLEGPFKHAMELDRKYLLSLDADRLLHVFRIAAGLPSKAKPYGGWMAPSHNSRGEFVGHYLSACAEMYASTADAQLKAKADRVVAGLAECQQKLGSGFLHTHPDRFTTHCEAPLPFWYQVHKVLAGLMDMHVYCDNQEAMEIARRLADWAVRAAEKFSDAQVQKMLDVEHGGINEALANLYVLTARPHDVRDLQHPQHAQAPVAGRRHGCGIDALCAAHGGFS